MQEQVQKLLRQLPAVDRLLADRRVARLVERHGRAAVVEAVRSLLEQRRREVLAGRLRDRARLSPGPEEIERAARDWHDAGLQPVLNATGVVIHTNLGRAPLAEEALQSLQELTGGYCNLEFDLASGSRGQRLQAVRRWLCELSGAEAALVVNNNAAAVYLALRVLAAGYQVVVSRGELVEIGGSFRIPDVMAASGAELVEVGTTNRTHLDDYRRALGPATAALLKVHRSNFAVVGFTSEVAVAELARLGHDNQLPLLVDLGFATFLEQPPPWLAREHHPRVALEAGADLVCFSGDKLLGGPQCGIVLGRAGLVERLARDPMARALRVDKLTLGVLHHCLRAYRQGDVAARRQLPVLDMLSADENGLRRRARSLHRRLRRAASDLPCRVVPSTGRVGGGALPLVELPGWAVALEVAGGRAEQLVVALRRGRPPLVARLHEERLLLDVRCLPARRLGQVAELVARAWKSVTRDSGRAA